MTQLSQEQLASIFARNWWVLLLRGIASIIFGALAWFMPGVTLTVLVLLFAFYLLADGVLTVWMAVTSHRQQDNWWLLLISGLLSIVIAGITFFAPGITELVLVFYIAIWAISVGVLQIIAAIHLRKEISGEWWLILSGLMSVVFGILLIAQPTVGALSLVWLIATFAFIFGVMLVMLALRVRKIAH